LDCFSKIEYELEHAIDKQSKRLIVNNIELFLNYCIRFCNWQFLTRENVLKGILEWFEILLNDHFESEKPQTIGSPTVAWRASEFSISLSYCGNLIKKESVRPAQEYIQAKVIDVAKERIFDQSKTVSQIFMNLALRIRSILPDSSSNGWVNRQKSTGC
jgi:AraC family transcriptional activator of pobA